MPSCLVSCEKMWTHSSKHVFLRRSQNGEANGKKSKTEPRQVDRRALAAQQVLECHPQFHWIFYYRHGSTVCVKCLEAHKLQDYRYVREGVLSQDEVAAVREKLTRLQQMAVRNANDRVISAQVNHTLNEQMHPFLVAYSRPRACLEWVGEWQGQC